MAALKSLADLQKVGGLVSEKPVTKSIKWTAVDPETYEEVEYEADVLLVKPPSGLYMDVYKNTDPGTDEGSIWIGHTLVLEDEKGKLKPIGIELARRLDLPLRAAVLKEIKLLAGMEKKTSPPSTNSSASSSAEASGGGPLPKLDSASVPTS